MKFRPILITATDTGVGKTFISYNLVYALREKGIK
ncbi:MAG TPA: ATP-dependent dethiobiotin synthetase BioD, partial [Aquificaceae bacterium]|nr:ATP-dependent dethiobiotin synthetase BioD [Aquificaceae bacterium]